VLHFTCYAECHIFNCYAECRILLVMWSVTFSIVTLNVVILGVAFLIVILSVFILSVVMLGVAFLIAKLSFFTLIIVMLSVAFLIVILSVFLLSVVALSVAFLMVIMLLCSVIILSVAFYCYAECHYTECCISIVMLRVVAPSTLSIVYHSIPPIVSFSHCHFFIPLSLVLQRDKLECVLLENISSLVWYL
jgi:hypothetical protein